MEDTLSLLKNATRVVDLRAAPGGWTQVVVERCAAAVVAVDLKDVAPVDGATILVGDLTSPLVIERIASTLDGAADVVSATAPRTCWTSAASTRTSGVVM